MSWVLPKNSITVIFSVKTLLGSLLLTVTLLLYLVPIMSSKDSADIDNAFRLSHHSVVMAKAW